MISLFLTVVFIIMVYWLYYKKIILENPHKSDDAWF